MDTIDNKLQNSSRCWLQSSTRSAEIKIQEKQKDNINIKTNLQQQQTNAGEYEIIVSERFQALELAVEENTPNEIWENTKKYWCIQQKKSMVKKKANRG